MECILKRLKNVYLPDLGEFWVFLVWPVRCAEGLCDDCGTEDIHMIRITHKALNMNVFLQETLDTTTSITYGDLLLSVLLWMSAAIGYWDTVTGGGGGAQL